MTKRTELAARREKADAELAALEAEERTLDMATTDAVAADLTAAIAAFAARRKAVLSPELGRRLDALGQTLAREQAFYADYRALHTPKPPVPLAALPASFRARLAASAVTLAAATAPAKTNAPAKTKT